MKPGGAGNFAGSRLSSGSWFSTVPPDFGRLLTCAVALSDSTVFGTSVASSVPTAVNAEIANAQKPYEGRPFDITIEQMEPEQVFSFRWHPFAIEPGVDYSPEPATLVAFALESAPDGVMLTITESGFDQIPLERRAKAFAANEQGWGFVIRLIGDYLGLSQ